MEGGLGRAQCMGSLVVIIIKSEMTITTFRMMQFSTHL